MRQFHRIVGLLSALFLVVICLTGIALQHWSLFSKPDSVSESPFVDKNTDLVLGDDGFVLVSTTAGVYRSSDGGNVFTPVVFPQSLGTIRSLAVHGDMVLVAGKQAVVLISYDKGMLWERISLPESIFELDILRYDGRTLHVVGNSGYWQSLWPSETGFPVWTCLDANVAHSTLYQTVLGIHSGYVGGSALVWLYTAAGIGLLGLIVTGLWIYPRRRR